MDSKPNGAVAIVTGVSSAPATRPPPRRADAVEQIAKNQDVSMACSMNRSTLPVYARLYRYGRVFPVVGIIRAVRLNGPQGLRACR